MFKTTEIWSHTVTTNGVGSSSILTIIYFDTLQKQYEIFTLTLLYNM